MNDSCETPAMGRKSRRISPVAMLAGITLLAVVSSVLNNAMPRVLLVSNWDLAARLAGAAVVAVVVTCLIKESLNGWLTILLATTLAALFGAPTDAVAPCFLAGLVLAFLVVRGLVLAAFRVVVLVALGGLVGFGARWWSLAVGGSPWFGAVVPASALVAWIGLMAWLRIRRRALARQSAPVRRHGVVRIARWCAAAALTLTGLWVGWQLGLYHKLLAIQSQGGSFYSSRQPLILCLQPERADYLQLPPHPTVRDLSILQHLSKSTQLMLSLDSTSGDALVDALAPVAGVTLTMKEVEDFRFAEQLAASGVTVTVDFDLKDQDLRTCMALADRLATPIRNIQNVIARSGTSAILTWSRFGSSAIGVTRSELPAVAALPIVDVEIRGSDVTDDDLAVLEGSTVCNLKLNCPNLTPAVMDRLRRIRALRLLEVPEGHEARFREMGADQLPGITFGVNQGMRALDSQPASDAAP